MDIGDTVEITFTTSPAATVTATWSRPEGQIVVDQIPVTETPPGSGRYPATFLGDAEGGWRAVFRATGTATAVEAYYVRFRSITGPAPFAGVDEYTELFGALSAARESLVRALLRRASQLVRDAHRSVDARIAAGTVSADTVGLAVLNMTARVMRNPNGLRSETTGPFSRAYDPDLASGLLTLTPAEDALLAAPTPGRRRAGTIWARPGLGAGHVRR